MPDPVAATEPPKITMYSGGNVTPVPDPTSLTTAALSREFNALKELFTVRLDASEKAVSLLQANADKSPSIAVVDERVNALTRLHDEKLGSLGHQIEMASTQVGIELKSIQIQFRERDTRTEQTATATKVAVDAALQAAKEAVSETNRSAALSISKSEVATIKSIDGIALLLQSVSKASDEKIADLKDRLAVVDARGTGQGQAVALVMAGLAVLLAVVAIVVAIGLHR